MHKTFRQTSEGFLTWTPLTSLQSQCTKQPVKQVMVRATVSPEMCQIQASDGESSGLT